MSLQIFVVFLVAIYVVDSVVSAFVIETQRQRQQQPKFLPSSSSLLTLSSSNDRNNNRSGFNPFREVADMFSDLDSVIDDFMNKRMGNGEVFYGKRKYKPSGRPNTEGKYNGMGISDKSRIAQAREFREEMLERLQRRREKEDGR